MGSTVRSLTRQVESEKSPTATIRWRSWPLGDDLRTSWLMPTGVVCIGYLVYWLGGGWLLGLVMAAALAVAMWQYLVPVTYEICSLGVRRYALRRMRLVPWSAIRAYQLRTTGVVFFQRTDPTVIDFLSSLYVPYPQDEEEMVIAVRIYLAHATELP